MNNFDIKKFLDLSDYITDDRLNRRKYRHNKIGNGTAEFFTPYSIVKRMCDKVSDEDWADPKKTFLEPSCGNGYEFMNYCLTMSILY